MARREAIWPKYVKKQARSARKTCRMCRQRVASSLQKLCNSLIISIR